MGGVCLPRGSNLEDTQEATQIWACLWGKAVGQGGVSGGRLEIPCVSLKLLFSI